MHRLVICLYPLRLRLHHCAMVSILNTSHKTQAKATIHCSRAFASQSDSRLALPQHLRDSI